MPILEDIAAMKPDAMETFSPPAMGGDTILAEAKQRIGNKVCMIGGFDRSQISNELLYSLLLEKKPRDFTKDKDVRHKSPI